MSWGSHDLRTSTISVTAQASKFPTITSLAHNNVSLIHTKSTVTIPHYRTNDPPSPSYGQSFPESVTTIENSTTRNNPPKPIPYVPIDPDSEPSSSDSSLLDSFDSGYSKQGRHIRNKLWRKSCNNNPIKKCTNLTANILKDEYNYRVTKYKSDEDPLQQQIYLLTFINTLIFIITI